MGVEWVHFERGHFVPEILQKKLAPMPLPTELLRQLSWLGQVTHTNQGKASQSDKRSIATTCKFYMCCTYMYMYGVCMQCL